MRQILQIFSDDIRSILKRPLVLVVAVAIATLPSLYAWINLYATWDPYGETEKLDMAVASADPGIDLSDGSHANSADEVIAELRSGRSEAADAARWCFPETAEEAIRGVDSGEYYAAIIFEEGFTYDMHHFTEAVGDETPRVTYYRNVKRNGVATKITDSASEELLQEINTRYVKTALTEFFGDTQDAAEDVDTDEMAEDAIAQLTDAREAIHDFNSSIELFLSSTGSLKKTLNAAGKDLDKARSRGSSDADKAKEAYEDAKETVSAVSSALEDRTKQLKKTIKTLKETVEALKAPADEAERQKLITKALEQSDQLLTLLQDLRALIPDDGETQGARLAGKVLDVMIAGIETVREDVREPSKAATLVTQLQEISKINNEELKPALKLIVSDIRTALKLIKPLLSSTDGVLDDLDPVLDSAGKTVTSLDTAMTRLQKTLDPLETRLDKIIDAVENADDDEKLNVLAEALGEDPDRYSSYFTELVETEVNEIYPAAAYGAAMAPFYTIIALWVGSVMMSVLLNPHAGERRFPEATETQRFFGRYLTFALIGQIQAAIVVAGDLFLFPCEPVHPVLMWLTGAVASLVFSLLAYAMALSFGHLGRAAVIVIMMVQIAGSSGSYPVEILPEFFGKLYRFFPFPYAINAMREALCGLHDADIVRYIAQLMVFAVLGLFIGLLLRRPFIGMDRYMTEKMEETEVL